jgi:hypothetical protein
VKSLERRPALILLIDGIGAIVSALFLGVVLTALQPYVGMPRPVLVALAAVALAYSAYSIDGYHRRPDEWRRRVRVISTLNLAYCAVTLALVAAFWTQLTLVGAAYFLGEIFAIGVLVVVERRLLAATAAPSTIDE